MPGPYTNPVCDNRVSSCQPGMVSRFCQENYGLARKLQRLLRWGADVTTEGYRKRSRLCC